MGRRRRTPQTPCTWMNCKPWLRRPNEKRQDRRIGSPGGRECQSSGSGVLSGADPNALHTSSFRLGAGRHSQLRLSAHLNKSLSTCCIMERGKVESGGRRPAGVSRQKSQRLLAFALCSPTMNVCANGCHSRFVFSLCPSAAATNAAIIVGIGS
jgi:hypothetical protein